MNNYTKPVDVTSFIFGKTKIPLLQKSLEAYSMRQKSIADNIANVNTPGFKRSEVAFEKELKKSLEEKGVKGRLEHPKHIPVGRMDISQLKPKYEVPRDPSLPSGVNNVDIDKEMVNLAKNQINYQAAAQMMTRQFNSLRAAIRGEAIR